VQVNKSLVGKAAKLRESRAKPFRANSVPARREAAAVTASPHAPGDLCPHDKCWRHRAHANPSRRARPRARRGQPGQPERREAFLHPRSAHGIVIQVAQQAGEPRTPAPRELPEPGPSARFDLIEHHVSDLEGATLLFREVLDGQLETNGGHAAELTWPGGRRLKLNGLALGADVIM
jgi:hypothetical protein